MKKTMTRILGIGLCLLAWGRLAPVAKAAEGALSPSATASTNQVTPSATPPAAPPLLIEAPQSQPPPPEPPIIPVPATPAPGPTNVVNAKILATAADTNAPVDLTAVESSETEEIIPLVTFDDVDLLAVIKSLARQSNVRFLLDPRVEEPGATGKAPIERKVSLRMEAVTAKQVLEAVLKNYGLQLVADPKTGISRITIKDPAAAEPLLTKVLQLQFSSPSNMVALLTIAFPPITRSSFLADPRTSQILIRATEKDMESIDKLILNLDKPTRQVLIEARILETSTSPSSIKGIDWSGTLEAQKFSMGNGFSTSSSTSKAPGDTTTTTLPSGRTVTSSSDYSTKSTLTSSLGGSSTGSTANSSSGSPGLNWNTLSGFTPNTAFLNADGVSAVLSFLNKDSDTELVATPRAVTVDNEIATLSITRAFPIFNITPGSANSPAGSSTLYTNLGTILSVTPRISGSNNIALRIVPEVSNIDGQDKQTINGQVNTANIYAIRKIETHVLVPSGNTLVMGGLINDNIAKNYTKVPLLGDLPGMGLLFRQDSKKRIKQNLLIFITPSIVRDADFQMNPPSNFLKTPPLERKDKDDQFDHWNSGKPYKWTKSSEK